VNNIEIGYAAGLFDGEGSISILRRSSGQIFLQVQISMICREVLEWFSYHFGGNAVVYKQSKNALGSSPICKWSISGQMALDFINIVEPYLIEKKDEAGIALLFPAGKRNVPYSLTLEIISRRRELLESMKLAKEMKRHEIYTIVE